MELEQKETSVGSQFFGIVNWNVLNVQISTIVDEISAKEFASA